MITNLFNAIIVHPFFVLGYDINRIFVLFKLFQMFISTYNLIFITYAPLGRCLYYEYNLYYFYHITFKIDDTHNVC